jgi:hypothetical protein
MAITTTIPATQTGLIRRYYRNTTDLAQLLFLRLGGDAVGNGVVVITGMIANSEPAAVRF